MTRQEAIDEAVARVFRRNANVLRSYRRYGLTKAIQELVRLEFRGIAAAVDTGRGLTL